MARFEITLSSGEKILVQHASSSTNEMLAEIGAHSLAPFQELRGSGAREVLIGTAHVMIVRPVGDEVTQGSNFRPKR